MNSARQLQDLLRVELHVVAQREAVVHSSIQVLVGKNQEHNQRHVAVFVYVVGRRQKRQEDALAATTPSAASALAINGDHLQLFSYQLRTSPPSVQ